MLVIMLDNNFSSYNLKVRNLSIDVGPQELSQFVLKFALCKESLINNVNQIWT